MKTKSLQTVTAIIALTAAINLSALAGPGPQPEFQARKSSDLKQVVPTSVEVKTATTAKPAAKPVLAIVPGAHGEHYAYRR